MGHVVVYELSPLHHVVGVQLAGSLHVWHDVDADQTGGGKVGAGAASPRLEDSVTVLRQESPLKGSVGAPPQRVGHVVTRT